MAEYSDVDDGLEYEEISRWAVMTLLFGLLSVTVLVHLIFWLVPLIALAFGAAGMRKTQPGSGYVGRSLVVLGLILAVFFSSCSVARQLIRRGIIYAQAKEHATAWLDLVRTGELYRAHQLLKPPLARAPANISLNEFYENDPAAKLEADAYFGAPPLKQLADHGANGKLSLVRNVKQQRKLLEDTVEQLYHLEYTVDGEDKVVAIETILMRRFDYKQGSCHWELKAIGMPE